MFDSNHILKLTSDCTAPFQVDIVTDNLPDGDGAAANAGTVNTIHSRGKVLFLI